VPNYHTGPDPPGVRINSLGTHGLEISASKLNKEILLRVPRPDAVPAGAMPSMPLWVLAGKQITLVVLPPGGRTELGSDAAAKVVYGQRDS
jgi:hypothetical protein